MPVNTSTRKAGPFEGNAATTQFPFAFKVFTAGDIAVTRLNSVSGVEVALVLLADYTVTLNADQDAAPGGTVTLPAPLPFGHTLTITGSLAPTQQTDLTNQGGFYPRVITNALDKLTILIQQLVERAGRAMSFPVSDTTAPTLPAAAARANRFLAFDNNGAPIAASSVSSVPVSSYMAGVLTSADADAARALLGVALNNRVINGDMRIDQRREGAAATISGNGAFYITDRWAVSRVGSMAVQAARVTVTRDPLVSSGFGLQAYIITPQTSLAAGDYLVLLQAIEGQRLADLMLGTTLARPFVVSFTVKATVPGIYSVAIRNGAATRSYVTTIVVAGDNTPERHTILVPGDTQGTWATDNTAGLTLTLSLAVGSTFQTSNVNQWQAGNFLGATGAANFAGVGGNNFILTDVDLQPGVAAVPFRARPFDVELMLCQRYYEKSYAQGVQPGTATIVNADLSWVSPANTGRPYSFMSAFRVEKRIAPTDYQVYSSATGVAGQIRDDTAAVDRSGSSTAVFGTRGLLPVVASAPANNQLSWHWHAGAEF